MSDHDSGKYTVYYRLTEDGPRVSAFETTEKPWDMDEYDFEVLAEEIGEWVYDNCDGWEWWRPDESKEIEIFWGEGDHEGDAQASRGKFNVTMIMSPSFRGEKA